MCREILTLEDGGQVGLDWLHPNGSEEEEDDDPTKPIVVILPGLTGSSTASYIKGFVLAAQEANFRVVVFNNRGIGGISLTVSVRPARVSGGVFLVFWP